jgi:hypothetical protein
VKGWALDLTRVGFEGWIQAVVNGQQVQAPPSYFQLQAEILSALTHWNDRGWLALNCPLTSTGVGLTERAEVTRQAITDAISRARDGGSGPLERPLRALELAYMKGGASHKQGMRSLSVSRATFYRLCKRGVVALAEQMMISPPRSQAETVRRD